MIPVCAALPHVAWMDGPGWLAVLVLSWGGLVGLYALGSVRR